MLPCLIRAGVAHRRLPPTCHTTQYPMLARERHFADMFNTAGGPGSGTGGR